MLFRSMKDYEYLRQLEYRLAIMRDKYDYLGGEYCTPEERTGGHRRVMLPPGGVAVTQVDDGQQHQHRHNRQIPGPAYPCQ